MTYKNRQSGFTAVELLITLFVAAAFLVAGYQLYNVIIKDSGNTRAQARASNVAYDYMRRYSPSATNPCTAQTPLTDAPISVAGIGSATVTVAISCPCTCYRKIQ
jgi:prepilin-type N-terminal cleavage/methylation domain-containing protein